MEIIKLKKELMRVARILSVIFIIALIDSCIFKNTRVLDVDIDIKKFKSTDGYSYINLQSYQFDEKKTRHYSVYHLNNLIFDTHSLENLEVRVLSGKFKIRAGAIGKQWININELEVKKGDSIVIKFFLKDDDSILDQDLISSF